MSTGERMRIERKDATGIVVLGAAASLNVFDSGALRRFRELLADLENDRGIRVILVTGEAHFCAGADIREMKGKDREEAEVFSMLGHSVCDRIEKSDKPVIAAIRGYALGAGCEIALSCDLRIASENARFGQPEVNLGLIPGFGGTQRLPRLIGIARAKELILTGRIIGSGEAERIGLVNRVVEDGKLLEEALETAEVLASKSPIALTLAKKLINENQKIDKELNMEIKSFAGCFVTEDHREGIEAFLEKRQPRFKGV